MVELHPLSQIHLHGMCLITHRSFYLTRCIMYIFIWQCFVSNDQTLTWYILLDGFHVSEECTAPIFYARDWDSRILRNSHNDLLIYQLPSITAQKTAVLIFTAMGISISLFLKCSQYKFMHSKHHRFSVADKKSIQWINNLIHTNSLRTVTLQVLNEVSDKGKTLSWLHNSCFILNQKFLPIHEPFLTTADRVSHTERCSPAITCGIPVHFHRAMTDTGVTDDYLQYFNNGRSE
jgi:hypothetical protein